MEHEFEFTIRLTRTEYDTMIDGLRRARNIYAVGNWGTWLRSELQDQMKAMGENPDPPKWPDYTGHLTEALEVFTNDR